MFVFNYIRNFSLIFMKQRYAGRELQTWQNVLKHFYSGFP